MKTVIFLFKWSSIILHIWTVIIAFTISGFWGGILTLFLPVLAEIYWFFKMISIGNWAYVVFWILQGIFALIVFTSNRN